MSPPAIRTSFSPRGLDVGRRTADGVTLCVRRAGKLARHARAAAREEGDEKDGECMCAAFMAHQPCRRRSIATLRAGYQPASRMSLGRP